MTFEQLPNPLSLFRIANRVALGKVPAKNFFDVCAIKEKIHHSK